MELAAYNLDGPVIQWYETLLESRNAFGLPPLIWEKFTVLFMIRFLSINKRDKFVAKFEGLKQTPGTSVIEYKE